MDATNDTHEMLFQIAEKAFIAVAFLYGVIVTAYLWGSVALQQPVWLFPGLYFLELLLLSGVALLSVFQSWPRRMHIVAVTAGVTTSFAVMGLFSIGLFYVPLALLLLIGSLFSWRSSRQSLLTLFSVYIMGGAVQIFGMLILASV